MKFLYHCFTKNKNPRRYIYLYMETSTILLIVALVVIVYVFFFFFSKTTVLADRLDLAKTNASKTADDLVTPESSIYSYECWVYVYMPKNNIGADKKYIFNRPAKDGTGNNIGLYLDGANTPKLNLEYTNAVGDDVAVPGTVQSIMITDNFPMQTWAHVIVSVQNNYIDIYLNGKLVKSIRDDAIDVPSATSPLVFGQLGAYLASFKRTTTATDPQTAWTNYLSGNGENPIKKFTGDYKLDLAFKNGDTTYNVNVV